VTLRAMTGENIAEASSATPCVARPLALFVELALLVPNARLS